MSMEFKLNLRVDGQLTEVPFSLEDYQKAQDKQMSLSQYINRKYRTDEKDGTAFEQCMAATGLVMAEDNHFGIRPPSLEDVFSGKAMLNSAIVSPDGADRFSPAGRYFFPAVLIDVLESQLRDNRDSYSAAFMDMVAFTRSITSPRYDQVIIDYTAPREKRSQPISQLAEPVKLLSITTSSVSRAIPTWAIGMEISDEAARAATLDQVAIALREHGAEERARRLNSDFIAIVNGDVDAGEAGLMSGAFQADSLDASITSAGVLTQKAWVKFLMQKWMRRQITHVVCNIDTYLAIEGRTGRPVKSDEPAVDERLNTIPNIALSMIPNNVKVFPMENFAANTIVGLDASKAMRRIVHVSAEYSAVEQYVMRRSRAVRIDTSERIESAGYRDAFEVMTLTV